jgi:transposase InsO family protein
MSREVHVRFCEGPKVKPLRPTHPYVWTREGWLYLAVVIDLFARRVVGWAAGDRLHKELALLPMAGSSRGGPATAVYNRFHRWAMRGWWHSLGPRADPPQEPISSGNSSSNS